MAEFYIGINHKIGCTCYETGLVTNLKTAPNLQKIKQGLTKSA